MIYLAAQKKTAKSAANKNTASNRNSRSSTANRSSKSSASGRANTRSASSGKSASNRRQPEEVKRGMNPQVKALLLCAVGVLLFALVMIPGGAFWKTMHRFLFGLFGVCALLVPAIFIYLGVMTAKEKVMEHKAAKILLSFTVLLFTCTLFYLLGATDYNQEREYFAAVGAAYQGSFEVRSMCGMLGAILGYPFKAWFTTVPAVIICVLVLIVAIMILTRVTLVDVARVAKRGYRRHVEPHIRRPRPKPVEPEPDPVDSYQLPETSYPALTADSYSARSKGRIDIPLDKPEKKPIRKDARQIEEEQRDESILSIIRTANAGTVPEQELDAAAVAQQITRDKTSRKVAQGAKQPDPQTVKVELPVETRRSSKKADLSDEVRRLDDEVKREEAKSAEKPHYVFPPTKLLDPSPDTEGASAYNEMQNNATKLIETLKSFGVNASITNICRGPSVTRYELQPAAGVKISKITNLSDDIALNLAANGVRIEAPIPGKAAVGIEVPNKVTSMVTLRELIETDEFRRSKSKLNCVLGRDISGEIVCTDLSKMPHLLIAGTTGSGKSVCVHALLMSILFKASPDEVKLLLIDPKMVEFSKYKGIPHLLVPVVSDAKKAAGALNWAVSEMLSRYRIFSEYDCKGVDSYNQLIDRNLQYIEEQKNKPGYDPEAEEQPCLEVEGLKVPTEHMSRIVIAIDELADLMMAAPAEVEEAICRLAQMARAAGMHLIIATQRPSVNVITGVIKANIPSRIALKVSSQIDSRTILDAGGAEKLIGRGDMLYSPVGAPKPIRVQCCFAKDEEIERVTGFIKKSHQAEYNAEIEDKIRKIAAEELNGKGGAKDSGGAASSNAPDTDNMMEEAIKVVIEAGQASTSLLQRRLKVGYARAGRMIDDMEQMGIVGPHQGSKPRDVLMTYNEWLERNHILGGADDAQPDEAEDEDAPW